MDPSFEQFLSHDNFKLAIQRLRTAPRDLYKSLYMPDLRVFALFEEENIDLLTHRIQSETYEPRPCYRYYLPKPKNLVRPVSVLNFIDLVVFQALSNVIADHFFDLIDPYQNKLIFGGRFRKSSDQDAHFFYHKWQAQWRTYNSKTREHFNNGYVYFAEFDFASYFDTIDHGILCNILCRHGVGTKVVALLRRCLVRWTIAENRQNISSNHGIPQGPIASSLLANLYLFPIDREIRRTSRLDIKYLRYVDDIRMLSRTEINGQIGIAFLDLLARDFGLIPQSEKVSIRRVENIHTELIGTADRFSHITREFKSRDRKLSDSTHRKLKKHVLAALDPQSAKYLDKTILRFSLFKLNADDDIRMALLAQLDRLYFHIEGVTHYFKTHFPADPRFVGWMVGTLQDDTILFHHIVAMIFKRFPELPFHESIYSKHAKPTGRFWLVRYYLFEWLRVNQKRELLRWTEIEDEGSYYLERRLNLIQYEMLTDDVAKKAFIVRLLGHPNAMLALQALSFLVQDFWFLAAEFKVGDLNPFVERVLNSKKDDFINDVLTRRFRVLNSINFFNLTVWNDPNLYDSLKTEFAIFVQKLEVQPSESLMSLDLFNEMVFDRIVQIRGLSRDTYGGSIDVIREEFPILATFFRRIHEERSQRTSAHYKDRRGNLRVRIGFSEYRKLLTLFDIKSAYDELCQGAIP